MSKTRSCLHAVPPVCGAVPGRFNHFEQREPVTYPQGDVMNRVRRGMITPAWQLGLRMSQRRPFSFDSYNSGCLDVHGCVADPSGSGGYACQGPEAGAGKELAAAYDFLNAPLAPDGFEYKPPGYMLKHPIDGPNSIQGWSRDATGKTRWQAQAVKLGGEPQGCAA